MGQENTSLEETVYISIDESGSMTKKDLSKNKFFVICYIRIKDGKKLKKALKRYISKKMEHFRAIDINNMMFDSSGKFKELKGSALPKDDKIELAKYLCKNNYFDVYYICVNNRKTEEKFYRNKARAFNYLLKIDLRFNLKNGNLSKSNYSFFIDERNVKTEARMSLEELLNDNLILEEELINSVKVSYYDSANCQYIQIADFFSNLLYSYLHDKNTYENLINKMQEEGYIKNIFRFPQKNNKN